MNCKYFTYRKMVSYDNGNTWSPTDETHRGMLIERDSVDCGGGYETIYKWVVVQGDYTCQGYDKYEKTEKYVSYDNGASWERVIPIEYGVGSLIEAQSEDCGYVPPTPTNYKLQASYSDSTTYELPCDSTSAITSGEVSTHTTPRSAMTSAVIGDCVNTIGDDAFAGCHSLSDISIPSGVTSIGLAAFNVCSGLTSINIPSGVTVIRQTTFGLCYSLSSITIPNAVTSIENTAFNACTSLTSIDIPSGVTSIGNSAFYFCRSLTSITVEASTPPTLGSSAFDYTNDCPIYVPCASVDAYKAASGWSEYASRIQGIPPCGQPTNYKLQATYSDSSTYNLWCDSSSAITSGEVRYLAPFYTDMTSAVIGDCVTSIGNYAFSGGTSLSSCTLGSSITSIGDSAFYWCTALTSIVIPNSVTSIGSFAFNDCYGLTSVTIGNGVTTIEEGTFRLCNALTSVNIPNSVTSIGINAFTNCTGLTTCTIGSGVTNIETKAFEHCWNLTSVTIPSGVTSIGQGAFFQGRSMTAITVNATTPPTLGSSAFTATNNCPIYVPCESVSAYKTANGWSEYASRIQGIPPCGRLPQGYTELEYVRHSTNLSNTKANCFTVQCDTTSGNVYTCIMKYEANNMYDYFFGNSAVSLEREQISTIHCCYYDYRDYQQGTFTNNVKQKFVLEPRTLKVYDDNGTLQQTISLNSGSKPYTAETTFGLMSAYKDDATMMIGNLYYFSVEDVNGVLKNEFIPCKRDSDNKIGVYDLVNNVFYAPTAFTLQEPT